MGALAEAFIRVRPNAAGMGRELAGTVTAEGRAAEAAAESLGLRMGRRMRVSITEQMKGVAGPLIASLAVFATFEGLKEMGKDAEEAAKETRLTEAAIKSTGEAAGVSAKQVEELAKHLSETTGKNEEVIHTGENLLLCLEESAQALTRDRGWVDHAALSVGDEILVYDPADDTSRWEPVLDLYRYEVDTELIHWRSKQIDVKTTPHHRWWTEGTSGVSDRSCRPGFMTTEEITGHQVKVKIGGGRPGGFRTDPVLRDDVVELLGWVATEGWFPPWRSQVRPQRERLCAICGTASARNRCGPARCEQCALHPMHHAAPSTPATAESSRHASVGFSQSQTANPKNVARIRELVDRLVRQGHRISETQYTAAYNGSVISEWRFAGALGQLVRQLLPGKKLTPELLGMLTVEQAELLLDTLIDGDGHTDQHGHRQYIQKDPGQLDVLAMLCAMLGVRTSMLGRGGDRDSLYLCETNRLYGHRTNAERVSYSGVVWCPQVRTGIFMARNRGRTFWTGNTFTGIKNTVGEGNDIFDQASAAIVDMSAAMNNGAVSTESLKSSALQLGKALNNPIAGMTALQRIGVSFTEAQKDQIKSLAQSGDLLGAQKIILKEVNTEFGGAAAATSSAMDRLGAKVHALKVQIGEEFVPAFNTAATVLAEKVAPAVSHAFADAEVGKKIDHLVESSKELAVELDTHLAPGMLNVWHSVQNLVEVLAHLEQAVQPAAAGLAKLAVAAGVGAFLVLARAINDVSGFMARHETVVMALAVAYGLHLLGGISGVVKLIMSGWQTVALKSMYAWEAATNAATSASVRLAVAQGALTLGVAAGVAVAFMQWTKHTQEVRAATEAAKKAFDDLSAGSTEALGKLAEGWKKASPEGVNLSAAVDKADAAIAHVKGTIAELSRETGLSTSRVISLAKAGKIDLTGAFGDVNDKFLEYKDSLSEGGAKQVELVDSMKELAASAGDAKKQVEALKNALDALMGKQLGVNEATRNYQASLDDLTDSVSKNGKTLDLTNEKGRANSEALDKVAKSIGDMITAEVAAGDSTDKVTSDFGAMYDQLIKTAEQTGMSEEAAKAYAASLGLIPENVNVLIAEAGAQQSKEQTDAFGQALDRLQGKLIPVGQTGAQFAQTQVNQLQTKVNDLQGKIVTIGQTGSSAAKAQIDALRGSINSLQSRQVAITVVATLKDEGLSGAALRNARLTIGQAEGGVWMQSFADGGFNGAKILPPGPTLWQWREPSTGGEAFIPMGVWHRTRSSAILGEVARRFGYQLVRQLPKSVGTTGTAVAAPTAGSTATATAPRMHPADLAAIAGRPLKVDVHLDGKLIDSRIGSAANLRVRGG